MRIKNKSFFVPPLLPAGVLLVLLPIFIYMAMERLDRQKEFITQKMVERAMAVIRTFEAGTRTGMFTMRWGANRIQAMLEETASQPEIEYIMIVSKTGRILAHSTPEKVDASFEQMPLIMSRLKDKSDDVNGIYHRMNERSPGPPVFEVVKRFVPVRKRFIHKNRPWHRRPNPVMDAFQNNDEARPDPKDWSRGYLENGEKPGGEPTEHYIFVGLSMEKALAFQHRLLKETVFRTFGLFVVGCAGLIAVFSFQAYRSARASLSRVKAFSDNVIQNMPTGLVTMDLEQQITSMNHAARQIFGTDLQGPFPEWIDLIHQMDPSDSNICREITINNTDDKPVRLEVIASQIKNNDEQITGHVFLFRDLSQIRDLQKQVETNKRLAAVGKLAAGVAHEIRNPLSSIKGFATYFAKRYPDNEADQQTAAIMTGEIERINRSITQLLEFAKPMSIELKPVNLKELIDHSLLLVRHDMEQKKIASQVDIHSSRNIITTDPDRMNQVFLNLYINAIEALEENGRLEVSVRDAKEKNMLEIKITDNGAGMDEDALDRIFDPYFTTRSTGTGLGLSIVHRIVENLNGTIRVSSRKGTGSCFTIHLPMTGTEADDLKPSAGR